MSAERIGLVVVARSGLGVLHELTGVIARHQGDIASVEIIEERPPESRIYFEIDLPGCFFAEVAMLRDFTTQEDLLFLLAEGQRTEPAHAVLANHAACKVGSMLDIAARAPQQTFPLRPPEEWRPITQNPSRYGTSLAPRSSWPLLLYSTAAQLVIP